MGDGDIGQPSSAGIFGELSNAAPGLDAISEVQVLSNSYSAEYGGLAGVIVAALPGGLLLKTVGGEWALRLAAVVFAVATAAATGWPPKVKPWTNDSVPCMNGSATRSEAISAPIGA